MMDIDKKELKIISLEFRTIANRLINCNWETGMDLLKKFMLFIDNNEIISAFIDSYVNLEDFNPDEISPSIVFTSMGDTKQEEISYTYQYLKYEVENCKTDIYRGIAYGYAREANNAVKEFCTRIILPFVYYIEGYLVELGIRMGYDDDVRYTIIVRSGGSTQLNLALDNSTISATQMQGIDIAELEKLIRNVEDSLNGINPEEAEQIKQSLALIESEIRKSEPQKGLLKTLLNGLQAINGTAQFGAAVATLAQFMMSFCN